MASETSLQEKRKVISEISDNIKNANAVILFDYLGLTVEEATELRKKLRESGSDMKVYKNTLTKRAMDELNINIDEFLEGPNAMAFSEDVVAPAKIVSEFAKKHQALEIKTGIIEGEVSSLETIESLASIPSREGLLTMLAGGMIQYIKDLSVSLNLLAEQMEEENPVAEVKEEETKEEVAEEVTDAKVEETVEESTEEETKEEETKEEETKEEETKEEKEIENKEEK